MFEEFEGSFEGENALIYHAEHCDAEMISAIALLEVGDPVAARQHIVKGLNIFADYIANEIPSDLDINFMAQQILMEMIACDISTVDAFIEDMEAQFV